LRPFRPWKRVVVIEHSLFFGCIHRAYGQNHESYTSATVERPKITGTYISATVAMAKTTGTDTSATVAMAKTTGTDTSATVAIPEITGPRSRNSFVRA